MRKEDTARINTHFLVNRLRSRGLKQWLLARELCVDRKTVARWVSGKVKRMSVATVAQLAPLLGCAPAELTLSDEADVHATRAEQAAAAELLSKQDLLQLLSPSDNWRMAEALIKAVLQPNLPLRLLGKLYNMLSITAWRQAHYRDALERAGRAYEIGAQLRDRAIQLKATLNCATVHSLTGPASQALREFEECIRHAQYFETPRDHAAALNNLSWSYREAGDLRASIQTMRAAIRIFEKLQLSFNLAIAYGALALHLTEARRLDDALAAVAQSRKHALASSFHRGAVLADITCADIHALQGRLREAHACLAQFQKARLKLEPYEFNSIEIVARVYRLSGKLRRSATVLRDALPRSRKHPIIHMMLLFERTRLAQAQRRPAEAERFRNEANRIAQRNGLSKRICHGTVPEYGRL